MGKSRERGGLWRSVLKVMIGVSERAVASFSMNISSANSADSII
jgi:hypothetical protein